jgi:Family of unknown function (DUF5954)
MTYMTVSGDESVWSRLGTALDRAGSAPGTGGDFPKVAWAHPVFYPVELIGVRWRILGRYASPTPQEARDELAHQYLVRASQAADGSREQAEYRVAADLLDRERHDQLSVLGHRFRIARVEQVLRTGPDGPEPPRPSDEFIQAPAPFPQEPTLRFIGDADSDVGPAAAALRAWLRDSVTKGGALPPEVLRDERLAHAAYPQVVLLGTWFAIGEHADGMWRQAWIEEDATPAQARASLLTYFRRTVPEWEKPGRQICAAYARAADILERDEANEITAAGRRFRITRIQRVARMNDEGPEGPRPSDFDPHPPPAA